MRALPLTLLIVFTMLNAPALRAQQWNGSTDSTGTIYRTGNVGIGISPSVRLHVVETAANTPVALFENTNSSFGSENLFTIKGAGGSTTGSSLFRILRGTTSILQVRWDGNVGIGTPTPRTKLYISNMGAAADAELTIDTENAYDSAIFLTEEGKTDIGFRLYYDSNDFKIDRYDNGPAVNALFIERTNGKVGIGTQNPNGRLEVANGGLVITNAVYANSDTRPAISGGVEAFEITARGNSWIGDHGILRLSGGGGTNALYKSWIDISGYSQVGDLSRTITFGTAGAERMRVTQTGNVGIGTTTPSTKLEVNGISYFLDTITIAGNKRLRSDGFAANFLGLEEDSVSGLGEATNNVVLSSIANNIVAIDANNNTTNAAFIVGTNDIYPGATNWVERFRIQENGNVGIGTPTPAYALDVAGTLNADSILVNGQALSATGAWTTTNDDLHYMAGNVGIGTSNPAQKLEVSGNVRVISGNLGLDSASEFQLGGAVGGGSAIGSIRNDLGVFQIESDGVRDFQLGSNTYPTSLYVKGNTGNIGIGVTDPQVALDIEGTIHARNDASSNFYALQLRRGENDLAYPALFSETTNGTLILAGDTHGNGTVALNEKVGIGTTNPTAGYKLDVNGDAFISDATPRLGAENNLQLFSNSGYVHLASNKATSGEGIKMTVQNGVGSDLDVFGVTTLNNTAHAYFINSNVGIGTTNPTSELAVNGTITSKEVIVTEATEAWPDFVFDEGYVLRSLSEVEQFIESEGHLPEVPSAEEVAENGVAMGAMQATLLQKIEELTLYLIDMKQEVDSLRAELDAVKKK